MAVDEEALKAKLAVVFPHLDERQQRILAGAEARAIGRGGIAAVARATGMSRATLHRALDLDTPLGCTGLVRLHRSVPNH